MKMRNFKRGLTPICFSLLLLVAISPLTAHAYTINTTTDVGLEDTLINVALLPSSGDQTEIDFVTAQLGTANFELKTGGLTATPTDEDPSILAAPLNPPDDYYVLKNSTHWALFQNNALLDWAVFETDRTVDVLTYEREGPGNQGDLVLTGTTTGQSFSDLFNLSSTQLAISHITVFGGPGTGPGPGPGPGPGVPVPAPLALFGLGGLLLGWTMRRKQA